MRTRLLLISLFYGLPLVAQWQLEESHVKADLRSVDYVRNGVAWAAGSHGTVLRTIDMGRSWQVCRTPPGATDADFLQVQAFNSDISLVLSNGLGDRSRLYKTIDGCKTWKLEATNSDHHASWDALQISEDGVGWLLEHFDNGSIKVAPLLGHFTCTGAGDSQSCLPGYLLLNPEEIGSFGLAEEDSSLMNATLFELNHAYRALPSPPVPNLPPSAYGDVSGQWVAASGRGAAFVYTRQPEYGDVIRSPDWTRAAVPMGPGNATHRIFSLAFRRIQVQSKLAVNGIAVGGEDALRGGGPGAAAYSDDGGEHWNAAVTMPHGVRVGVAYDATSEAWIAVGMNGTDVSTDNGRNWRRVPPQAGDAPDADRRWSALSPPFAVGPNGRIGKLREGAVRSGTYARANVDGS